MTVNLSCMVIVIVGGATLGQSPFNVIQLLWINMVMDSLAAIALATEPPSNDQLGQKLKSHDPIVLPVMFRQILGQSLYQIIVMLILLYFGPLMFDINYNYVNSSFYDKSTDALNMTLHYTLMFNTFMYMQFFNEVNCRKLGAKDFNIFSHFFNNLYFLIILGGQFAMQYVFVEFGGYIFRTAPLPLLMHVASLSFGVGSLLVSALLKATPEVWLEKIKFNFNESKPNENDLLTQMTKKKPQKAKKGELERLLDE